MILLIDNFDSFTHNIALLFNILKKEVIIKKNNEISIAEVKKINPSYLVVGPGPGSFENSGISMSLLKYFIKKNINIPIMGICLGHQIIAHYFGSKIIKSQNPMHGKKEQIFHDHESILKKVKSPFFAIRYNSLSIDNNNLSPSLKIIAKSDSSEIMAIKHIKLPIIGIQFHPESIFSEESKKIFKKFLKLK